MQAKQILFSQHVAAMSEFGFVAEPRGPDGPVIWLMPSSGPNADIVRQDARERGLRVSVPWSSIDEVVVSAPSRLDGVECQCGIPWLVQCDRHGPTE